MEQTGLTDSERRAAADDAWWHLLGVLWRRKAFLIVVTGLVAVASVVISLMLPNWYKSTSRVLLPEGGPGGIGSAMLGDISSALSLFGGGGGDYVRYLAILNSRTVMEATVDTFNLEQVYELEDEEFPRQAALDMLSDKVDFLVDDEFENLNVEAVDTDAQRAANMANFLVRMLSRVDNRLASRTAGQFRKYVEERFDESRRTRMALLDSLQTFQEQYGVIDLESQLEAYFTQLAQVRISVIEAEIQYETLKSQFGEDNTTVRRTEDVVRAARNLYNQALAGGEQVLPVSQEEAPSMVHRYAELTMERTIQEKILEVVAPILEQARFDEQRDIEDVQVVDPAVPAVKKFKPKRSFIVIGATLSAFILAAIYVLIANWWRVNSAYFYDRLTRAAEASTRRRS
jgi:uncharacterized protein involved in exopolysaccharide biosynthesis